MTMFWLRGTGMVPCTTANPLMNRRCAPCGDRGGGMLPAERWGGDRATANGWALGQGFWGLQPHHRWGRGIPTRLGTPSRRGLNLE